MNSQTQEPKAAVERKHPDPDQSRFLTAPLPDPIGQNIDAITALHTKAEQKVDRHQRAVERLANTWGQPAFLYSILCAIGLWLLPNVLPRQWGTPHFDPPPFSKLELLLSTSALLLTTGVLIRQNRQEKLAEQRAQLNLQISLLSEQKLAKLIALVEELRRDSPDVHDRHDPEAEVMQEAADPHTVMTALEQNLDAELAQMQQHDSFQ